MTMFVGREETKDEEEYRGEDKDGALSKQEEGHKEEVDKGSTYVQKCAQ